ncbi:MAG: hypothetical protein HC911_11560 [Chloroflexaceae bacterium]|nr:hypothetical protein [Chloroflexaceae bacterium]
MQFTLLRDVKRVLPTIFTGAVALIVIMDALLDTVRVLEGTPLAVVLSTAALTLVNWGAVLIALALLLGLVGVVGNHLKRVRQREADWQYSIILLGGMISVILLGTLGIPDFSSMPPRIEAQNLAEEPIRIFFRTFYEPLASSLLALLAFFSLSAMLRAVRQRNREGIVIVVVAMLLLIVQFAPIASLPLVTESVNWLNSHLVLAGARALLLSVAIGTLVASMRVLLGFDQPYLDR